MVLHTVKYYYKQHGFFKTLKRVLTKIGFQFFHRSIFFLKLNLNPVPLDSKIRYCIVTLSTEDIEKDKDYYDGWFSKQEALVRLQKGYRLFVIRENDRIICCAWVEFRQVHIPYLDLLFHIPKNMAYLTGRFTVPELRGKGIAPQLEKGILQYLKKEGYRSLLCINDATNAAARRVSRKTGYEDYQLVNYRRYWFIKYFCVKKCNSKQSRTFVTISRAPEKIWNLFL